MYDSAKSARGVTFSLVVSEYAAAIFDYYASQGHVCENTSKNE